MKQDSMEEVNNNNNKCNYKKVINISLGIFCISIVIFTIVGAVVIDNYSNLQQIEELSTIDDDGYKGEIDERLRFIAMQDDDKFAQKEADTDDENTDDDEVADEPEEISSYFDGSEEKKNKFTEYNEKYRKKTPEELAAEKAEQANDIFNTNAADFSAKKDTSIPATLNLKVVVGNYATLEEAQTKLKEIRSQFTAPPFVKMVGGKYTLQVAAFRTPATAQEFANSLKEQGYSVRIIEE